MEFCPALGIGWLNGWIPLAGMCFAEGLLLLLSPKDVVTKLFDRSGWDKKQKASLLIGKLFSLACLVLLVLTPLKPGTSAFVMGMSLYGLGLVGLVLAILDFKTTPPGQLVTKGLYRASRHPQILALFVIFVGMCLATGSWLALLVLIVSRLFQHPTIVAEEEACLRYYGDSYRSYMRRTPRYFLIL